METAKLSPEKAPLFWPSPKKEELKKKPCSTTRGAARVSGLIRGLKEKSLAAMRADISTVIIPKLNEKDLVDVPEEARQKLRFVPVETVEEVLAHALDQNAQPLRAVSN